MNKRLNLLLIITILSVSSLRANNINLEDAIKNGLVKCSFKKDSTGTHYTHPVLIHLVSNSSSVLSIKINSGLQLIPSDSNYQNLIVTQDELFVLQPYKKFSHPIYAMCTEHSDRAPDTKAYYSPSVLAKGNLGSLAQMISKDKTHDLSSQQAVWCLSNNESLESIGGNDSAKVNKLRRFISKAKKEKYVPFSSEIPLYKPKISYEGKFNYNFGKVCKISIVLFNENGVAVKELYFKEKEMPGQHQFKYEMDISDIINKNYSVKLVVDNDVELEQVLNFERD